MKIKFVPQDFWIGLYWKTEIENYTCACHAGQKGFITTWYLCLIPCLPIIWKTYTA